jgi:hypothetical protein
MTSKCGFLTSVTNEFVYLKLLTKLVNFGFKDVYIQIIINIGITQNDTCGLKYIFRKDLE